MTPATPLDHLTRLETDGSVLWIDRTKVSGILAGPPIAGPIAGSTQPSTLIVLDGHGVLVTGRPEDWYRKLNGFKPAPKPSGVHLN